MRLRIGVVGLGDAWDTQHRPAFRSMVERFELRALTTAVQRRAEQAAQEFKCHVSSGFQALAARDDIDAVMLLGREWYGPLPIMAACEHGKAVYCSTTFDMEPARVESIRQRVDAAGIAFMTELPRRHAPATLRLKELIATQLGPPKMIFCHQRASAAGVKRRSPPQRNPAQRPFQSPAELSLLEQLDWCRYVMGEEISGVYSVEQRGAAGAVEYQMLSLDFPPTTPLGEPRLAQVSYGQYMRPRWPEAVAFRPPAELQVCCENGVAFIDLPARITWFDEAGRHHESLEHDRPVGEQLLNLFHRSVTSLVRRTSGLYDACVALRVLQAARQSVQEQRRINTPIETDLWR